MKRIFVLSLIMIMLLSTTIYAGQNQKSSISGTKSLVPANEGKIAAMLIKDGKIGKNASSEEIEKAVDSYLAGVMKANIQKYSKSDMGKLQESIARYGNKELDYTNLLHGKKLGKGLTTPEGAADLPWDGEKKSAKLLILLAEFGTDEFGAGPLHNEIGKPGAANNADLWVSNFDTEHYNKMLFTEGGYNAIDKDGNTLHLDSMVDYYKEQSGGSFAVEGQAYGWFKVNHSEAYYGNNTENGTDDQEPGDPRDLVRDVLNQAAIAGVPFDEYDMEDPYDLDGDSNFYEPDGIIDRLIIAHAGVDESGGGGVQGTDAIWAHSWDLQGLYKIPGTEMYAYNYTMQGENGDIGVFCHEFAHDLGLPDEYDTIYSGNGEAVGFYSLMASGSWTGKPLGTKPSPLSPYGKMLLQSYYGGNWAKIKEVDESSVTKAGTGILLDQSTSRGSQPQIVKVDLPVKAVNTVKPYEGSWEWYSLNQNNMNSSMSATLNIPAAGLSELNFWTWYNVETGYDYGYVEVSADNGASWDQLAVFNGSSGGWVNKKYDLTAYAGKGITIRFRCTTDGGWLEKGMFLDLIKVTNNGNAILSDNAEADSGIWTYTGGFSRNQGFEYKSHYYLIEYRTLKGTDEALNYGYNFTNYDAGTVEFFRHEPGMLVWYVDEEYNDNWVGVHPGHSYLGIVDSHSEPIVASGIGLRTRIQIHDAAFSLESVIDKTFTFYEKTKVFQGKQAVPEFNDAQSYWTNKAPSAGLILPDYGLKFKIIGRSADGTQAEIALYR